MSPDRIHEILSEHPLPYTTDLDLTGGALSMRVAHNIVRRKATGWWVNGEHFPCILPDDAPVEIVHAVIVEMISQSRATNTRIALETLI